MRVMCGQNCSRPAWHSGQLPSESTKQPTGSKVSGLELGDCGADLNDTADDLMSGNAWIDSWHRAPLITDLVEVRVADTAEKDFDLNVVFARISPRDRGGGKRRFRTRQQNKPSLYTGHVIQR